MVLQKLNIVAAEGTLVSACWLYLGMQLLRVRLVTIY